MAICRGNLPWECDMYFLRDFAAGICCGIFVYVNKSFLCVSKSRLYGSKHFLSKENFFICVIFFISSVFFSYCRGNKTTLIVRLFLLPSIIKNIIVIIVFPHFKSFKSVNYTNEQNKKNNLIIGTDCYHKLFTNKTIRGKEGEPVAQKTYFGCILNRNISTLVFKNPSFVTSLQINTSLVLNLSTEFGNEIFEN